MNKLSPWVKQGNSEVLMKNVYFEIVKDKVKIKGVPLKDYVYMNLTDSAMIIVLTADKKIVLVRQYRYLVGSEVLEFPAGGCDANEDPEICARRECEEEIGYKCGKVVKLGQFYEGYGLMNRQIHIYFSNDVVKTLPRHDKNPMHYEEIDIEYHDYKKVLQLVEKGKIVGGQSVLGILLLKEKIEKGKIKI